MPFNINSGDKQKGRSFCLLWCGTLAIGGCMLNIQTEIHVPKFEILNFMKFIVSKFTDSVFYEDPDQLVIIMTNTVPRSEDK